MTSLFRTVSHSTGSLQHNIPEAKWLRLERQFVQHTAFPGNPPLSAASPKTSMSDRSDKRNPGSSPFWAKDQRDRPLSPRRRLTLLSPTLYTQRLIAREKEIVSPT